MGRRGRAGGAPPAEQWTGAARCPGTWQGAAGQDAEGTPGLAHEALEQAQRDGGAEERAAVAFAEVRQGRTARRLVVLDFDIWQALLGRNEAQ